VRIGTAGWSIPADVRAEFPVAGSALERYATRFSCVEINSSFYRSHRTTTYARWAASVPATFRFSVKLPKAITHEHRLGDVTGLLESFLDESSALREKRGALLIQLPPSLAYAATLSDFFDAFRARYAGFAACEPRHMTWFCGEANAMLRSYAIARVAADPALPGGSEPGGDTTSCYFRWHGSPRRYYDRYGAERLRAMADSIAPDSSWCIFDNTAAGGATADALQFGRFRNART